MEKTETSLEADIHDASLENKHGQQQKKQSTSNTHSSSNGMALFKFVVPGLPNDKSGQNHHDTISFTDDDTSDLEKGRYTNTDEMFEEDELVHNSTNLVYRIQTKLVYYCKTYTSVILKIIAFLCFAGYTVYFGFAISKDVDRAKALIIITMVVLFLMVYVFIRDHFGDTIYSNCWVPLTAPVSKYWDVIQW